MKKITLQDIANELDISRVTVWKALNDRKGVSPAMKQEVISKALELGYPIILPNEEMIQQEKVRKENGNLINVSVAVSRPETSVFWMNIIHNAAKVLSDYGINLIYTYLPATLEENYSLPQILTSGSMKGMIVLNIYDQKLFHLLNSLPVQKVFLDCIPGTDFNTLKGDLFLLEGKSTVDSMVQHIIIKGARDISFIGDIKYAQTNKERYLGYVSAMTRNNLPVYMERSLTGPIGIETYEEEITLFLNAMSHLPDAFICANDYIAKIVLQLLKKRNIQVPGDIMIAGFDDNPESGNEVAFTTVHVQNDLIGIRLAQQLIYHLNNPCADYEITYIRSKVLLRESTGD